MKRGTPSATADSKSADRGRPRVVRTRAAGVDHQVVTVVGASGTYRRKPCSDCPWRVDTVGEFPAKAFRHSAGTAYDMSDHVFACHQAGAQKPVACAGFLLRGADHNLAVRLKRMKGEIGDDVADGGHALHLNYRERAIANGVDSNDPILGPCRD